MILIDAERDDPVVTVLALAVEVVFTAGEMVVIFAGCFGTSRLNGAEVDEVLVVMTEVSWS